MADPVYDVLFLSTANSSRSIMAEAILNREGKGRFRAHSAGSKPSGQISTHTSALLSALGYDVTKFRSKSWDEFVAPGAPEMDFVFTVCDEAAGEVAPPWPGRPASAHWSVPDPGKAPGSHAEVSAAFDQVYRMLATRVGVFVNLPLEKLDRAALHHHLTEIGAGRST